MLKSLFFIIAISSSLSLCAQTKVSNSFTIDTSIRAEVKKRMENSKDFSALKDDMQIYNNPVLAEFYENDKLMFTSKDKKINRVFKSFFYWENDTLKFDGAFGLFTGLGFTIEIYKNNALLYHLVSSDESPIYSYKEKGSLISRLEVPCTDTKIVLSEMPDSTQTQVVYGYVEFKSGNYYASNGAVNGVEESPRKKLRANMKIYFKSSMLIFLR